MDAFLAEIRLLPYAFAPRGWASCDGKLLSIAQNTALFSLIGTYYGGDGRTTFALPDLRGATPVGQGQGPGLSQYWLGERAGSDAVTLFPEQMARHPTGAAGVPHALQVSVSDAVERQPPARLFAKAKGVGPYAVPAGGAGIMSPSTLATTGNSAAHNNMQPYVVVQYCICLEGIYPRRP